MTNVTILVPSNDALRSFLNDTAMARMPAPDSGAIAAVLSYHVLNGTYFANNFTDTPMFIETMLENSTYENVTGGQVVEARKDGDMVSFYSALKTEANITQADLNFNGGVVHTINRVLEILMNLSATYIAANLITVIGAISVAHLTNDFIDMQNMTVFAPNNGASQLLPLSITLENGTLRTVEGSSVNISVDNGIVYVNKARVILPDVLISNGVVHVIDNVLNPSNKSGTPNPTTTGPAFSGASTVSGGNVPFTSNIHTPTETATGLETLTSPAAGVPHATAAVAFGALFGGAAMVMNGLCV
ncbi:hypothetical protein B7463_g5952, partial [Scytalidium lignicola]